MYLFTICVYLILISQETLVSGIILDLIVTLLQPSTYKCMLTSYLSFVKI